MNISLQGHAQLKGGQVFVPVPGITKNSIVHAKRKSNNFHDSVIFGKKIQVIINENEGFYIISSNKNDRSVFNYVVFD